MDLESNFRRFLEITGDAQAAALLVLAGQIAAATGDQPTTKPLSVGDVAKLMKVSPEKVRSWCRSGALRATNVGSARRERFLISRDDLDAFMQRQSPAKHSHNGDSRPVPKSTRF